MNNVVVEPSGIWIQRKRCSSQNHLLVQKMKYYEGIDVEVTFFMSAENRRYSVLHTARMGFNHIFPWALTSGPLILNHFRGGGHVMSPPECFVGLLMSETLVYPCEYNVHLVYSGTGVTVRA